MQFILDNLMASIIAMTLFLMLVVSYHGNQEAQVRQTNFYALRKQQLSFVKTLRSDMAGVTRVGDVKEDPTDLTFSFTTRIGEDADTTHITYKRRKVGSRNGVDLYQVQRYEEPSGSLVPGDEDGASMPTITAWKMVALNEVGNTTQKPADVRRIRIQFEALAPFEDGSASIRWPWEATFQPIYLQEDKKL